MKLLSHIALGFVITLVLAGLLASAAQGAGAFTQTGSLGAVEAHTATLLPNGKVLVAGGAWQDPDAGTFTLSGAGLYDPATGTWSPTGDMGIARQNHTATLLPNGKVLVAGGLTYATHLPSYLASAEIYDPATGTWSPTGSMGVSRAFYTATLLPNGKVLVAGASNAGIKSNSAELYDPATGIWSPTGSMGIARGMHTATLLPNGKVLVVAGDDLAKTAELYNPATGTWSPTASLATARQGHTATLLPNGKVLVAGGSTNSVELYNPAASTWSPSGSLATARQYHTATLLSDGQVLVAGGLTGDLVTSTSAELYNPATGAWSSTGSLGHARYFHTATLLANGQVLLAAGHGSLGSAELYASYLNPISNLIRLGDGSIHFDFSNPSGTSYHVLASADLSAPLNTWSNLGLATETPPGSGQFQFTDHQAPNYSQRFYRVTSP